MMLISQAKNLVAGHGRECSMCKLFKPWDEFSKNKRGLCGHNYICKVCMSHRIRAYRIKNWIKCRAREKIYVITHRQKTNERETIRHIKLVKNNERILLQRYMPSGKWICQRCGGEFHFCQINAHHIDPNNKKYKLNKLMRIVCIGEKHFIDLDKCEWLCARCHQNVHHNPYTSYAQTNKRMGKHKDKMVLLLLKKIIPRCIVCGDYLMPKEWEWHHRDPSIKKYDIAEAICYGFDRLWVEIQKCDLLCRNCHALLTHMGKSSSEESA